MPPKRRRSIVMPSPRARKLSTTARTNRVTKPESPTKQSRTNFDFEYPYPTLSEIEERKYKNHDSSKKEAEHNKAAERWSTTKPNFAYPPLPKAPAEEPQASNSSKLVDWFMGRMDPETKEKVSAQSAVQRAQSRQKLMKEYEDNKQAAEAKTNKERCTTDSSHATLAGNDMLVYNIAFSPREWLRFREAKLELLDKDDLDKGDFWEFLYNYAYIRRDEELEKSRQSWKKTMPLVRDENDISAIIKDSFDFVGSKGHIKRDMVR